MLFVDWASVPLALVDFILRPGANQILIKYCAQHLHVCLLTKQDAFFKFTLPIFL